MWTITAQYIRAESGHQVIESLHDCDEKKIKSEIDFYFNEHNLEGLKLFSIQVTETKKESLK